MRAAKRYKVKVIVQSDKLIEVIAEGPKEAASEALQAIRGDGVCEVVSVYEEVLNDVTKQAGIE